MQACAGAGMLASFVVFTEAQVIELTLPAMTCGHCVKTVTETVHGFVEASAEAAYAPAGLT